MPPPAFLSVILPCFLYRKQIERIAHRPKRAIAHPFTTSHAEKSLEIRSTRRTRSLNAHHSSNQMFCSSVLFPSALSIWLSLTESPRSLSFRKTISRLECTVIPSEIETDILSFRSWAPQVSCSVQAGRLLSLLEHLPCPLFLCSILALLPIL